MKKVNSSWYAKEKFKGVLTRQQKCVKELFIFKWPKGSYMQGLYAPLQLIKLMIHIGVVLHQRSLSTSESE